MINQKEIDLLVYGHIYEWVKPKIWNKNINDVDWKDVKDIYMENKMNLKLEELVGKPITEAQFDEAAGEKDACYRKVKSRYKVWPSAYASGWGVRCTKAGGPRNMCKSKKED